MMAPLNTIKIQAYSSPAYEAKLEAIILLMALMWEIIPTNLADIDGI
ncbi:MAG: hypothetical protein H0A76_10030 [Candidatus Thiodubiliella endoseptemdiera]|uniref:Uncharacterized protein n=1 Tax=Candidatus Thiodubiliella endoseptemdiera TaxID=2738886 RepID=A0A853F961_9GAMM|nr:hypothetical protein [Candidatus Thiodubiliella endoseptemdiera]